MHWLDRSGDFIERHPSPFFAAIMVGILGICAAAGRSDSAAEARLEVLHAPPPEPYIVCPHCEQRFNLNESRDFDESGIEQYIDAGRRNWFHGEPR